jgi:glutathione S-transferase
MGCNDALSMAPLLARPVRAHVPRMTGTITLYRHPISGHSHRAQLLLSLLDLPYRMVEVDLPKGEQKRPDFLAKNPLGEVPVIEDGELTLSDSNAILIYLALRYDPGRRWYPEAPQVAARVQRWLSLASGKLVQGPGALRLSRLFRRDVERAPLEALSAQLFSLMEATLSSTPYLVGADATLADIAMYTYTAVAPEGGVSLAPYPALGAWLERIEALPGFVAMTRVGGP